jgi:hypothetical protein
MTADFAYDPVTVIDEANAVRETAVLFAEIRQIMRIPLVTSIWRGLAGTRSRSTKAVSPSARWRAVLLWSACPVRNRWRPPHLPA